VLGVGVLGCWCWVVVGGGWYWGAVLCILLCFLVFIIVCVLFLVCIVGIEMLFCVSCYVFLVFIIVCVLFLVCIVGIGVLFCVSCYVFYHEIRISSRTELLEEERVTLQKTTYYLP